MPCRRRTCASAAFSYSAWRPAMSAPKRTSRDVAAEITDLIIRKLEEGVPPWSRPWRSNGAGGRPVRHCGTPYQGINTLYRSEEHTSELQSLMRISYAVFCLKKKKYKDTK